MQYKKTSSAFTMIEMVFVIIIVSLLYAAILKSTQKTTQERAVYEELNFYKNIDSAFKETFLDILDTFEPICSVIPSDATNRWGWGHPSCATTSPLPVFSTTGGKRLINYSIQFTSLSAGQQIALENKIIGSFNGVCTKESKTNTQLSLYCPKVLGVTYSTTGAFVATSHTVGSPIDPQNAPTVRISYNRQSEIGTFAAGTTPPNYDFSLGDIFIQRRNYSLTKMNEIRQTLKNFYHNELTKEFNNAPAIGLHSMDDEFVFWAWKVFGDNASSIRNLCTVVGGTCSNLNSNNIWRSSLSGKGLFVRKMISNILNGDNKYSVDGFGNQLNIYPIASQCGGADFASCAVVAPPIPADNYIAGSVTPPYTSVLYVQGFGARGTTTPAYTKMYLTY